MTNDKPDKCNPREVLEKYRYRKMSMMGQVESDLYLALKISLQSPYTKTEPCNGPGDIETCYSKGCVSWSDPCPGTITRPLSTEEVNAIMDALLDHDFIKLELLLEGVRRVK